MGRRPTLVVAVRPTGVVRWVAVPAETFSMASSRGEPWAAVLSPSQRFGPLVAAGVSSDVSAETFLMATTAAVVVGGPLASPAGWWTFPRERFSWRVGGVLRWRRHS